MESECKTTTTTIVTITYPRGRTMEPISLKFIEFSKPKDLKQSPHQAYISIQSRFLIEFIYLYFLTSLIIKCL